MKDLLLAGRHQHKVLAGGQPPHERLHPELAAPANHAHEVDAEHPAQLASAAQREGCVGVHGGSEALGGTEAGAARARDDAHRVQQLQVGFGGLRDVPQLRQIAGYTKAKRKAVLSAGRYHRNCLQADAEAALGVGLHPAREDMRGELSHAALQHLREGRGDGGGGGGGDAGGEE